jgi:hypothetical protein
METITNKIMGGRCFWLTMVLVVGISTIVVASKGGGETKEKKGYVLKFNGFEVKKTYLTPYALMQQGATYRGISTPMQNPATKAQGQSVITFQKGNTIYLYPVQPQSFLHKLKIPSPVNR